MMLHPSPLVSGASISGDNFDLWLDERKSLYNGMGMVPNVQVSTNRGFFLFINEIFFSEVTTDNLVD